jgi:hypothetical protein
MGIEDHFGVSPLVTVTRVYAKALAQQVSMRRMKENFFKA